MCISLYREKMADIDKRLEAVKDSKLNCDVFFIITSKHHHRPGSSQEYLQQLQELEKVLDQRQMLAGIHIYVFRIIELLDF